MSISLEISIWEKFAKRWQPAPLIDERRSLGFSIDIGEMENNPIIDDKFDIDDELDALDALYGRE